MTREEFTNKLISTYNRVNEVEDIHKDGFDVSFKNCLVVGVRVLAVTDDIIIIFGGYGLHFEMIQSHWDEFNFEEVTTQFENYYHGIETNASFNDLYFCEVDVL